MKISKKIIISSVVLVCGLLLFGIRGVFAGLKFTTFIDSDINVVNNVGENINLTFKSDDIVETGISSGQFYIEYDSNVFSINENSGIDYLQYNNNFSSSFSEDNGKGKITLLYYDNSNNLNETLSKGELFKLNFEIKNIPDDTDNSTIKITGEGFSTIQNEKIVEITPEFVNKKILFRNKDLLINDVSRKIINGEYNKPYYNGVEQVLLMNIIATDIDKNAEINTSITKKFIYGDIDINGVIDKNDLDLLNKYLSKEIDLSDLQKELADINQNGSIDTLDADLIEKYLGNWKSSTKIGEINNELSKIYYYGDINLDGVVDENDRLMLTQYLAKWDLSDLNDIQLALMDITGNGSVDAADAVMLNRYLANEKINNVNRKIDGTNYLYGDVYLDNVVNYKDLELLKKSIESMESSDTEIGLNGANNNSYYLSEIQSQVADINNDGNVDNDDYLLLEQYLEMNYNTSFSLIGTQYYLSDLQMYGDLNNDKKIDESDYEILSQYINNNIELTDTQLKLAKFTDEDINQNNLSLLKTYIDGVNSNGHRIGKIKQVDGFINNYFNIVPYQFSNKAIIANNFDLNIKSNIDVGLYDINVAAIDNGENIISNTYTLAIEPQKIENINFYEEEYTVGENNTVNTDVNYLPSNSYLKKVKYSMKDTQIATVDENGVITGKKVGETIIYADSLDGSNKQASAKVKVLEKSIQILSDSTLYKAGSKRIEDNFYDEIGAVFSIKFKLINVDKENLNFVLYNSSDNNKKNIFDKTNSVQTYGDENCYYLDFNIDKNILDIGSYIFKIIDDSNVESNEFKFDVLDYIHTTDVDILYNNQSINSINIMANDDITFASKILPEDATDTSVKWKMEGIDNAISTEYTNSTLKFKAGNTKGSGTITLVSDDDNKVMKTINVNIVDSNTDETNTTFKSNIDNNSIDIKYGGKFITELVFDNTNFESALSVKLLDQDKNEVSDDYYTIDNIPTIKNGKSTIEITIKPNKLSKGGKYFVSYSYNLNDIKSTKKTGEYYVVLQNFVSVQDLNLKTNELTLIKGQKYTFDDYEISNFNYATYPKIKLSSSNEIISINDTEITANEIGETQLSVSTIDDSNISKTLKVKVIETDISSEIYNIDKVSKYLKKIKDKKTKNLILNDLSINSSVKTKLLNTKKNEISDSDLIGTGMFLQTYINEKLVNEYKFIVSGDINGDGKILANDILAQKMDILNKSKLESINFIAGDIDEDNKITARDILYLKMYILNKSNNVWGDK